MPQCRYGVCILKYLVTISRNFFVVSPSVRIIYYSNYNQALLDKHKSSMEQLIHRDRNHPSVIMWSIANEPRTSPFQADSHFQ